MLKNFITTLVVIGTLLGTPISFVIQDAWSFNVQVAHAALDDYEPSQDLAYVKPATPLSEDPTDAFGLDCGVDWSGISFDDCFAVAAYYIFYAPSGLILHLSGGLFDAFLALSVSPLLLEQDFVKISWGTIRNLVNLLFIIILLWISLATILQIGGVQLKQAVINVIIVALLVNFSFFFTRVVIDASNVIAMEFYNRAGSKSSVGSHIQGIPEKRISDRIMGSVNPQALLSPDAFDKWKTSTNSSNAALIFLFFVGGIINLMVAYVLFYAGFLMVGRVIAFIFLIIASPLAFISYALPKGGGFTSSWWNQLLNQAMVAPVFLFFLYVIVQLLSGLGGIIKFSGASATAGTSFADLFTTVALKATIVVVALMIALNKAKSLSGAAGSYATKAGTAVFGAAAGTAAFAGRHTIGRAAKSVQDSAAMKQFVARTGVAGEMLDRGLGATAKGSMDFRGLPGGKNIGLGSAGGKGGYDKHLKDQISRKVELGKRLEKGKHGENVLARNWRGKPVIEMETIYEDVVDPVTGKPVMELDSSGKPVMGPDGPLKKRRAVRQQPRHITAREQYTRKLEQGTAIFPDFKKQGYEASRNDRDAARELRKTPTETDKIIAALTKQQPPAGGTPAGTP